MWARLNRTFILYTEKERESEGKEVVGVTLTLTWLLLFFTSRRVEERFRRLEAEIEEDIEDELLLKSRKHIVALIDQLAKTFFHASRLEDVVDLLFFLLSSSFLCSPSSLFPPPILYSESALAQGHDSDEGEDQWTDADYNNLADGGDLSNSDKSLSSSSSLTLVESDDDRLSTIPEESIPNQEAEEAPSRPGSSLIGPAFFVEGRDDVDSGQEQSGSQDAELTRLEPSASMVEAGGSCQELEEHYLNEAFEEDLDEESPDDGDDDGDELVRPELRDSACQTCQVVVTLNNGQVDSGSHADDVLNWSLQCQGGVDEAKAEALVSVSVSSEAEDEVSLFKDQSENAKSVDEDGKSSSTSSNTTDSLAQGWHLNASHFPCSHPGLGGKCQSWYSLTGQYKVATLTGIETEPRTGSDIEVRDHQPPPSPSSPPPSTWASSSSSSSSLKEGSSFDFEGANNIHPSIAFSPLVNCT